MSEDQPSTPRRNRTPRLRIPVDVAEVVRRPDYLPIYIPPEDLARVEVEDPTLAALWHAQSPKQRAQARRQRVFTAPPAEERAALDRVLDHLKKENRLDDVRDRTDPRALATAIRAVELRQARDDGWPEGLARLARVLILTSLPQRRTSKKQVIREIRLGSGRTMTVIFTAAGKAPLPHGADTNVLHYLFDRLDPEAEEPFVRWDSAADYFRWWGMDPNSYKNQRDLRDRWKRLASLVVHIAYEDEETNDDDQYTAALFPHVRLPKSIDRTKRNQLCLPGQEYGVTINRDAWPRLAQSRVPVPKTLLRSLREDPFLLRLTLWLHYRVHAARTESVVPWDALRAALGSDDQRERRFRGKIRDGILEIRQWWPDLDAQVAPRGLRISPGRPLLPRVGGAETQPPPVGTL